MIPVKTLPGTRPDYFGQDMFFDIVVNRITKDYPLHWHDFYELEYIESGHATQIINGKSYQMSPGFVVLLSPVDFHSYENVSADDPLVIHNIRFSDLIIPASIRSKLGTCAISRLSDMSSIIPMFHQLTKEYQDSDFGREEFIRATITQLCIMVLRQSNIETQAACKPVVEHYSPIQEAVLYIRNHYRDSITIDEVASIVHLTPNYFSEYFKKQTGVKFCSYVQKLRLEFSVSLLKLSDLSIKEIADQSGFNSAAYFSNAFKDYFGVSPEQFRKSPNKILSPTKAIIKEIK